MLEPVSAVLGRPLLEDQVAHNSVLQVAVDHRGILTQRHQSGSIECAADNRSGLQERSFGAWKRIQASANQRFDRFRNPHVACGRCGNPASITAYDHAFVDQHPKDFFHEQGVAL